MRESDGIRFHDMREGWGETSTRQKGQWGKSSPWERAMG